MNRAEKLLISVASITEASKPPYPKNFERMYKDLKSRGVDVSINFDDHRKCWYLASVNDWIKPVMLAAGYVNISNYGAFDKWLFHGDKYMVQTERSRYFRIAPESRDSYGLVSTIATGPDPF